LLAIVFAQFGLFKAIWVDAIYHIEWDLDGGLLLLLPIFLF
jgi:hypothetical protein